jgi:hypothetical protein
MMSNTQRVRICLLLCFYHLNLSFGVSGFVVVQQQQSTTTTTTNRRNGNSRLVLATTSRAATKASDDTGTSTPTGALTEEQVGTTVV